MADPRFYRNPFAPDERDRYRRGDLVAEWTYPDGSKEVLLMDGTPVPRTLLPRSVLDAPRGGNHL